MHLWRPFGSFNLLAALKVVPHAASTHPSRFGMFCTPGGTSNYVSKSCITCGQCTSDQLGPCNPLSFIEVIPCAASSQFPTFCGFWALVGTPNYVIHVPCRSRQNSGHRHTHVNPKNFAPLGSFGLWGHLSQNRHHFFFLLCLSPPFTS